MVLMKTQKINNSKILKRNKSKDVSDKKTKKKIISMMEELIFKEKSIKYIINEKKNPAHTKEVNECYYILLASICYCITSNEIKLIELSGHKKNDDSEIEISYYSYLLKEINKVLQKLNDDLYIYLNEMYIIDELIQVIELFKKNYNIEKINEIKNNMRENALIIQKNSSDSNIDSIKLSEELIDNFIAFYNLIMNNGDIIKKDKYFYEKVRYILFKEIKKIPDIMYRYNILEKVLEENEIIKKSTYFHLFFLYLFFPVEFQLIFVLFLNFYFFLQYSLNYFDYSIL